MSATTPSPRSWHPNKIQQVLKWTVYTLLLINFAFYIGEDWTRIAYTLTDESTPFDWLANFATSIDEMGWILLLCMLELETYVLENKNRKSWATYAVRGVRLLCYAMIAHTLYTAVLTTINLQPTVVVENVSDLCNMVDEEVAYVYNLEYTDVTMESCETLSAETEFYWVASEWLIALALIHI